MKNVISQNFSCVHRFFFQYSWTVHFLLSFEFHHLAESSTLSPSKLKYQKTVFSLQNDFISIICIFLTKNKVAKNKALVHTAMIA